MSTATDSLPEGPDDISRGSSVSSAFMKEYEEILKYAIVAPKIQIPNNVYDTQMQTSSESTVTPSSDESLKIIQKKTAKEKIKDASETEILKAKSYKKKIRFNTPHRSALDTLLEYSDTPVFKNSLPTPTVQHQLDNINSSSDNDPVTATNLDKDLLRMDELMDDWSHQLKQNVLAELAAMKGKDLQKQDQAIIDLKNRYKHEMIRQTHEVDNMKELLFTFEQSVKQKDEVIHNLTEALTKQKERSDKIRLFSVWRLKHNDEQRQDFSIKMAEKYYKKMLASKVWIAWRGLVENKWKVRVEKACQVKSQEVCLQLTQDYEERLQSLQQQLNEAREEVAKMHKERECYEETMKKAFMRGVCALNMEAMSMFKEGGEENHNEHPGEKHVMFEEKHHEYNQENPQTKKIFNVKMTGKLPVTGMRSKLGRGKTTISSVKVERHVPSNQQKQTKET